MARKEITVTIETEGRDQGKVFLIKELSAQRAEDWAARLLLALTRNGVQVPENVLDMGMAGIAAVGIRSIGGIPWDQAKPLLDEMMACVRIQPSPSRPNIVRALIDRGDDGDDIEEITTRITLREAWITLHTGFSIAGFLSKSREAAEETDPSENGGDIAISPGALVQ
jgi:hypothetical protein